MSEPVNWKLIIRVFHFSIGYSVVELAFSAVVLSRLLQFFSSSASLKPVYFWVASIQSASISISSWLEEKTIFSILSQLFLVLLGLGISKLIVLEWWCRAQNSVVTIAFETARVKLSFLVSSVRYGSRIRKVEVFQSLPFRIVIVYSLWESLWNLE